jgi:hypothetical protein
MEEQQPLVPGEHPSGNSIRKAYLCHSPTRVLPPGSVAAFYRSQDLQALTCIGVVEQTLRSSNPDEIAATVARRTVYTYDQIKQMCSSEILVILFRQSLRFNPPIRLKVLVDEGVLKDAPMSVTKLGEQAREWIKNRIQQ